MSAPLAVALDIGTSSVRALAFDSAGRKVSEAVQITYDQTTTPDGGVEVDADYLLDLTGRCLDELLPQLEGEIAAVGISCFWHSLMAVGPEGRAETGVFSWADNRSAAWIPALRATLDERTTHARTGCVFHTSYWPAKLLWLNSKRPEIFRQWVRWMGFGEYLALKWCGETRMGLSMASGTGLFHQNKCKWDREVMAALPIQENELPPLCDLKDALPPLLPQFQERWPQLKNVPWFPAIGDGACSNIGSGCGDATKIGLNAGTSGALRIVLENHTGPAPRGLWRYRIDARRSIIGGALSNAGNVLAWARGTFQIPEDWQDAVTEIVPDSHGLTILPFLAGERAPLWNGNARFVLEGASLDTNPTKIIRAVMEGAALRFAAVGQLLLEIAPEAQIVFSGGALEKVPVWQAIVCDAIGAPLLQSCESEASARGAALLALEAAGVIPDAATVPFESGACLQPNKENARLYARALERQNLLYEKLYADLGT
jgi:gluconokinase